MAGTNITLFGFNVTLGTVSSAAQLLGQGRGRRVMRDFRNDVLGDGLALERKDKGAGRGRRSAPERDAAPHLSPDGDVGSALRLVFEQTISEDIPPEMLDLLNKLA